MNLPKNDGSFDKQIQEWKQQYLKKNEEGITEEAIAARKKAEMRAKRSRLERFLNIPSARERLKQDYCRLEAKKVRALLDGREEEAEKISKKLAEKKKHYKNFYCKGK